MLIAYNVLFKLYAFAYNCSPYQMLKGAILQSIFSAEKIFLSALLRILCKSLILVLSQFLIITCALIRHEKYSKVVSYRTFSACLTLFF